MRIAIIGVGLIGGSIGLALKQQNADLRVIGIPRREETVKEAIAGGAIDCGTTDPKKGVADADIVFICTPINLIIPILKEIAPALKKGAIATDVGSSKYEIVSQADKIMPKGTYFVGGHPMAGKEKVKLKEAEATLFNQKLWILAPTSKTSKKALEKISDIVTRLHSNTVIMDPKLHDLAVAGISHMPLAVAAALVDVVAASEAGKEEMQKCAASGFRDTTRIASGDPILGVDMFTTNKKAVLAMISAFKKSLSKLERLIKEGDAEKIEKELERVKNFRNSIL
ncbi:MAG: prephenate dehydrogenase/arogenate dehydrogenase family protein [Candidatus Saganbacteria bacterium]|nr:prephenate dehydrogenase/arogenate dehydrogenase family protein [Candidatus Saganbacteria bacterium]